MNSHCYFSNMSVKHITLFCFPLIQIPASTSYGPQRLKHAWMRMDTPVSSSVLTLGSSDIKSCHANLCQSDTPIWDWIDLCVSLQYYSWHPQFPLKGFCQRTKSVNSERILLFTNIKVLNEEKHLSFFSYEFKIHEYMQMVFFLK